MEKFAVGRQTGTYAVVGVISPLRQQLGCECKRLWLLKNSVIGMSFWLRVSLLASFFFLTSTKWWLPPWVLSVG